MIVTVRTSGSLLAPFRRIYYFQWGPQIVHVIVIGYFSYTAIETSIIEIRIGNARIFYSSDLKWPKTVEIAEKKYKYKLGV